MSAPNATTTMRRTRPNTIDAFNAGRCFDQRRPQKVAETTSKSALGFATAFGLARWQAGSQGYWLTSALEGSECFLEMNGPKRQTRQSQIHKTNCYCHGDHHILDHHVLSRKTFQRLSLDKFSSKPTIAERNFLQKGKCSPLKANKKVHA